MDSFRALTGRRFDLSSLSTDERNALNEIRVLYARRPSWEDFAQEWIGIARSKAWRGLKKLPVGSTLYRISQDLELRLGITEGHVAAPDYRDRIADLIEERFGSRYAFCKQTGIDQGNLSHVLAGTRHFSPETLTRALEALGVRIELADRNELALDPFDTDDRAGRLRRLDHRVAVLENLAAKAKNYTPERRHELVEKPGLFPDDLDPIRERLKRGEDFDTALRLELQLALDEQASLTRMIAEAVEQKRQQYARATG